MLKRGRTIHDSTGALITEQKAATKESENNMSANWAIARIDKEPHCTLQHWQVFEVNPNGPFFLPRPGPRIRIFIGIPNRSIDVQMSYEIVAFDPIAGVGLCESGKTYCLGQEAGFTPEMKPWYTQRWSLAAAEPVDVTCDVLAAMGRTQTGATRNGVWDGNIRS